MSPFALWLSTYATDAVAERPWWMGDAPSSRVWRRRDGMQITKGSGIRLSYGGSAKLILRFDAIDDEHPLPIPPPMGTQVWAWPDGTQHVIGKVWGVGGGVTFSNGDSLPPGMWPPQDAVLVGGPHAPWAPRGWRP